VAGVGENPNISRSDGSSVSCEVLVTDSEAKLVISSQNVE